MSDTEFVSYAQHGEDVVLWRALGSVTPGRYVEVGAKEPNGPVTATATSGGTDIATDQLAALKIIGPPNR